MSSGLVSLNAQRLSVFRREAAVTLDDKRLECCDVFMSGYSPRQTHPVEMNLTELGTCLLSFSAFKSAAEKYILTTSKQ